MTTGTETLSRPTVPEAAPDALGSHEILPKMGTGLNGENIVDYAGRLKDLAKYREDYGYMRVYSRRPEEWTQLKSELRAEMGQEAGLTLEEQQIGDAVYDTVTWAEQLAASPPPEFAPRIQVDRIDRRTGGFYQEHQSDHLRTHEKSKEALGYSLLGLQDLVARYDLQVRGEEPTEEAVLANSGRAREIVLSLLGQYKTRYENIIQGVENHELEIDNNGVAQRELDQIQLKALKEETAAYEQQTEAIIKTVRGMGHGHGGGHGHDHEHEEEVVIDDWRGWRDRIRGVLGTNFDTYEAPPVGTGPFRELRQRMRLVGRKGVRNPDKTHLHYYALPQHAIPHRKHVKWRKEHMGFLEKEIAQHEHVITQEAYDRAERRNDMLGAVVNGDLIFEIPQNGNGSNGLEELVKNMGLPAEQIPGGTIWRFGEPGIFEHHRQLNQYLSNRFQYIKDELDALQSEGPGTTARADRIGQKLQQVARTLNEGVEHQGLIDGDPAKTKFIKEHALASARLIDWLFRTGNRPDGIEAYHYEEQDEHGSLLYNDVGYKFYGPDGNPIGVFWADGSRASWDADNDTAGQRLTPTGHQFQRPTNLLPLVDPHIERLSQKEINQRIHIEGDTSLTLDGARASQDEALLEYDRTRTPESLATAWEASVKLAELREVTAKELIAHIVRLEEQGADAAEIDRTRTNLGEVIEEALETRMEQAQLEARRQGREVREVNLGALAAGLAIAGRLGKRTAVPVPERRAAIAPDGSAVAWGNNVTIMTQDGPVTGEVLFNGDSVIVSNPITRTSAMYAWDGSLIATTA